MSTPAKRSLPRSSTGSSSYTKTVTVNLTVDCRILLNNISIIGRETALGWELWNNSDTLLIDLHSSTPSFSTVQFDCFQTFASSRISMYNVCITLCLSVHMIISLESIVHRLTLYWRVAGSTISRGLPFTLIRPFPLLQWATAVAVFFKRNKKANC